MARGYCVDCNYDGPLSALGDCPRCGSDWTEKHVARRDEDQLDGLYSPIDVSLDSSASDLDYYEL